jgi:hypothetical protein
METLKLVVDQNYSVNHEATAVNAAGQTVSAKDVLCAEAPAAILALNAFVALTNNGFVKGILTYVVIPAIQVLMAQFCPNAPK